MQVLVTGSSGALGQAVIDQLRANHRVVGLDRVAGPLTDHVGEVQDEALVRRLVRGADAIVHTASLHAPHVGRIPRQAFVDVNVSGTLLLLEAAVAAGLERFVYTGTTSVYGLALVPTDRAVWVTEELPPRPRDVYDVTKLAAEGLCETVAAETGLPTICLRVARFFPESPEVVATHRLSRGVDVRDAATAHRLALENRAIDFGVYNVAARSPFVDADAEELLTDAPSMIHRRCPTVAAAFASRGWALPGSIDRVYVIAKAEVDLGYRPEHNADDLVL